MQERTIQKKTIQKKTSQDEATQIEPILTPFSTPYPSVTLTTVDDIQEWLISQVAEQIGIDPDEIDPRVPFDSYGLDSVQLTSIASLGKRDFGLQLSPIVIWSYPTIELLSQYLARELEESKIEILEL